jgi:hypothetical protein
MHLYNVKITSQLNPHKMKTILLNSTIALILFLLPGISFGQAPTMGTAANFVLFSTSGALSNTGISELTGNVGSNNTATSTGFGNVNGVMDNINSATGQCAADLLTAYNQLKNDIPTIFPVSPLGNNDTLIAGIYEVTSTTLTTLEGNLYLNAQGNANAVFIFQIEGPLSAVASSKIILINGALACNVFWKVEGLVSMASGATMRGTIIANNAAIHMGTGDTLEGRALSTAGAITTNGVLAYTPIGCGSPVLTGPAAPNLSGAGCYAIFSGNGAVTNTGITHVIGDIGTNIGLTTGYTAADVTGTIHPIPDGSTAACATYLGNAYTYLNGLTYDIQLLYPAQFGRNLVLTPHTYLLNAATTFTDSLYLNAEGDVNAVFVIQIKGALSTSTYSKVILINGAQAENVFWLVDGAVSINGYSVFNGTIIANNGALHIAKLSILNGRAMTTNGQLITDTMTADGTMIPADCAALFVPIINEENVAATLYPNPFGSSVTIMINDISNINNCEVRIYNLLGEEVMNSFITNQTTTIATSKLPSGMYFYQLVNGNKLIQSGKLISQN